MRNCALACCLTLGVMASAQAQGVDLTMPPDFRADRPAPASSDKAAKVAKRKDAAQHTGTKLNREPIRQAGPPDISAPSRAKPESDPLSLGMSWNANNTSEGATRATSGLSEVNKNHDGEAAGLGAKLGLGYKF
jgi:hypothetical protein